MSAAIERFMIVGAHDSRACAVCRDGFPRGTAAVRVRLDRGARVRYVHAACFEEFER